MTTSAKQHVCISSETSIMMMESEIENKKLKREKNRSQKNLGGKKSTGSQLPALYSADNSRD